MYIIQIYTFIQATEFATNKTSIGLKHQQFTHPSYWCIKISCQNWHLLQDCFVKASEELC